MDVLEMFVYVSVLAIGAVPLIYLIHIFRRKNDSTKNAYSQSTMSKTSVHGNGHSIGSSGQKKNATTATGKSTSKHQQKQHRSGINKRTDKNYEHPWLMTTLKGHTDQVYDIDFSSNGKYLASCSEDRSLLLWSANNIGDTQHRKSVRVNVEFDHAIKVAWSPDTKALIIHKYIENCIEVIKMEKKDGFLTNPTKALTFTPQHDTDVIVGFGISCTGRFIMTCSNKTDLVLLDLRGKVLEKIDTCLMSNYAAKISPCGRFIAACGFSPDVKVWEVKFNKTGEYQKTVSAFNLCGHNSGIYDIAFDQDSSHVATVSKDGFWKLYDTKIEYHLGQLPRCLLTAKYTPSNIASLIALSPSADVVAIASGYDVEIFSALTGIRDILIENIYVGEITALLIDPMEKYIITAGDKHVRLFHNLTGYKAAIENAKQKLKHGQTAATRERLEKSITDNELFLKKFQ